MLADSKIRRTGVGAVLGLMLGGMLIAAGCFSSSPTSSLGGGSRSQGSYTVRRGDTLHHIAQRYGVTVSSLMTANGISNPRALEVGQVLTIPGYTSYGAIDNFGFGSHSQSSLDFPDEHPTRIFAWPVEQGQISSGFGIRNGTMHDGLDIAAPAGTPVHAAEGGTVIYSGRLRGYGNVIIVRHDEHYVTVYGHNSENLVREGDSVARGQVIGNIGASGRTTGANLHFEVRRDNIARNPLAYLPRPDQTAGISFARNVGG
jgi:murein DD-endopeptidase MepM/ murein hydrolase activator NlpD